MIHLRPARPDDAPWAVPLIQATIGSIGLGLTGTADDAAATAALLPFFQAGGNRLGFDQTLVAELDGLAAGLAVSYAGDQAKALDEAFSMRLKSLGFPDRVDTEAETDEWYLDTLATLPAFRGRGVGRTLIAGVADLARRAGWTRLGLLVEPDNARARHLYGHLGFREMTRRSLADSVYLHLGLPLTP